MFNTTHIDPAQLNHPSYQRPTDLAKVNAMASGYDNSALGAITVAQRSNGSLWTIDGAHRAAAAIQRGDKTILANVHEGLSLADEAALFLKLNNTKQVAAVDKFKASVIAGDPTAVAINDIVERRGWRVAAGGKDGRIVAVTALEYVYMGAGELPVRYGPGLLNETLSLIFDAWGLQSDGVSAALIRGVGRVIGRCSSDMDGNKVRTKFRKHSPGGLYGDARTLAKISNLSMSDAMCKVLVNTYNVRMTKGALPEWEVRK